MGHGSASLTDLWQIIVSSIHSGPVIPPAKVSWDILVYGVHQSDGSGLAA